MDVVGSCVNIGEYWYTYGPCVVGVPSVASDPIPNMHGMSLTVFRHNETWYTPGVVTRKLPPVVMDKMFETPFTVHPFAFVIAIRNVFDDTGFVRVDVTEQFIKRPALIVVAPPPPPPPPVIATFNIFVMRPHLSTVICATSFASPYVPGRTDPEQHPPFAMESVIYYSARIKTVC